MIVAGRLGWPAISESGIWRLASSKVKVIKLEDRGGGSQPAAAGAAGHKRTEADKVKSLKEASRSIFLKSGGLEKTTQACAYMKVVGSTQKPQMCGLETLSTPRAEIEVLASAAAAKSAESCHTGGPWVRRIGVEDIRSFTRALRRQFGHRGVLGSWVELLRTLVMRGLKRRLLLRLL
mmetsp:Transcript_90217/g.188636  ORF Transcript_90217/g.188636 Transcript_90217/m.188636 type:complete len:178 (-) Transcript_90217:36-569(-)